MLTITFSFLSCTTFCFSANISAVTLGTSGNFYIKVVPLIIQHTPTFQMLTSNLRGGRAVGEVVPLLLMSISNEAYLSLELFSATCNDIAHNRSGSKGGQCMLGCYSENTTHLSSINLPNAGGGHESQYTLGLACTFSRLLSPSLLQPIIPPTPP